MLFVRTNRAIIVAPTENLQTLVPMPAQPRKSGLPVIFWVIWLFMITAIVTYQFTLGHGLPTGENRPSTHLSPVVILAGSQALAALLLRGLLIPRTRELKRKLVFMIAGLGLSEAIEFFGLFLVPATQPNTKLGLFVLALLCAFLFAPIYANSDEAFTSESSFRKEQK